MDCSAHHPRWGGSCTATPGRKAATLFLLPFPAPRSIGNTRLHHDYNGAVSRIVFPPPGSTATKMLQVPQRRYSWSCLAALSATRSQRSRKTRREINCKPQRTRTLSFACPCHPVLGDIGLLRRDNWCCVAGGLIDRTPRKPSTPARAAVDADMATATTAARADHTCRPSPHALLPWRNSEATPPGESAPVQSQCR